MSVFDDYYANLLIMQYHNKPRAKETIKVSTASIPDQLILDIINGDRINVFVL